MSSEGNGLCREAQLYYHDFLFDEPSVPRPIVGHIDGCPYCRGQVWRLKKILAETQSQANPRALRHGRELIAELQSHFEDLGRPLSCRQAKPLLPGLLIQSIRIPTPVTAHVERCPQCSEDLERLRSLALTEEQLARLGRLYAEPVQMNLSLCGRVQSALDEEGMAWLEDVPAGVADHVCLCPRCRDRMYEFRQDLLDEAQSRVRTAPSRFSCARITMGDIFDLAVPYGRTETSERRAALAEHVFSCSECLARLQHVHRTAYDIAERADSGVVTVYSTTAAAGPVTAGTRRRDRGGPIKVRVLQKQPKTAARQSRKGRVKIASWWRGMPRPKLKPLYPLVFLAGGVIFLAVLPALRGSSASAVSVRQIGTALSNVRNVHITTYDRDIQGPVSEVWVSHPIGIFAEQTPTQEKIYNMRDRRRFTITPGRDPKELYRLSASDYEDLSKHVEGYLDFSLDGLSRNGEMERKGDLVDETGRRIDIYETIWQGSFARQGRAACLLRFYIDRATLLVIQTNFYRRVSPQKSWGDPETTQYYAYPSDSDIQQQFGPFISDH